MVIESECHLDYAKKEIVESSLQWTNASCGISTFYCIPFNPFNFLKEVYANPRGEKSRTSTEAFVLFSDVVYGPGYRSPGHNVAAFIKDHPVLGPIVETPPRRNPNTGSIIQAWLWAVERNSEAIKLANSCVTLKSDGV